MREAVWTYTGPHTLGGLSRNEPELGGLSLMMPQNCTPRMALVFALFWGPEYPQLLGLVRVGEQNSGQELGAAVKGVP